jgi:hypothetical protein
MANILKETLSNSIVELCNYYEMEIQRLRGENDALKFENHILSNPNESIYITILLYVKDNGEGVPTEECIGVFSNKAKALKYKKDLMYKGYNSDSLIIEETSIISEPYTIHVWVNYKEGESHGCYYREYLSTSIVENKKSQVSERFAVN